jgi:hypothetical protein
VAAVDEFAKRAKRRVWRTGFELAVGASIALCPWFDPVFRGLCGGVALVSALFMPTFIKTRKEAVQLQAEYRRLEQEERDLLDYLTSERLN